MIAAQPVPKEIRRPTTMLGRAAGKITLRKSDAWSVQPSTCPACTSTGSMRFTPAMVESRVGNSVATQTTNTLPASPMPNQRMASGIDASGRARVKNTLLACLGQRLLREGRVEPGVVVGLQDFRVLQEPGVGVDRGLFGHDVAAVDRNAFGERVTDDVLGKADLLGPHPRRGFRILEDKVDRLDVGGHQVLHDLGSLREKIVMYILA